MFKDTPEGETHFDEKAEENARWVEKIKKDFVSWMTTETTFTYGVPENRTIADWWVEVALTEARKKWLEQIVVDVQVLADRNPPALLLNSIVDYAYDQLKALIK